MENFNEYQLNQTDVLNCVKLHYILEENKKAKGIEAN